MDANIEACMPDCESDLYQHREFRKFTDVPEKLKKDIKKIANIKGGRPEIIAVYQYLVAVSIRDIIKETVHGRYYNPPSTIFYIIDKKIIAHRGTFTDEEKCEIKDLGYKIKEEDRIFY